MRYFLTVMRSKESSNEMLFLKAVIFLEIIFIVFIVGFKMPQRT